MPDRRHITRLALMLSLVSFAIFMPPSLILAQDTAGKIVYVASSYGAEPVKANGIYLYDSVTHQDQLIFDPVSELGSSGAVREGSWSADGTKILFVADKRTGQGEFLTTIDADGSNFKALTRPDLQVQINTPSWSPDDSRIAYVRLDIGDGGSVTTSGIVVMGSDGSSPTELAFDGIGDIGTSITRAFGTVAWSPDSKQIAFSSSDGNFVANADGSGLVNIFSQSFGGPPVWSPDGKLIAFTGFGDIRTVDLTGAPQQTLYSTGSGTLGDLAWSPDGKQILFTYYGKDGQNGLLVFDLDSQRVGALGTNLDILSGAWQPGSSAITITPEMEAVAVSLMAGAPTPTPTPEAEADAGVTQIRQFLGHKEAVLGVAFSPDGKTIMSASADNTLLLWDVATGKNLQTLSDHKDYVYSAAFSPDGAMIVSGGGGNNEDYAVRLWDVASGQVVRELTGNQGPVYGVAFAPDGKTVLSGGSDRIVRQWDVTNGKLVRQFSGHDAAVDTVAFSIDGALIVTSSDDMTARVWNAKTGASVAILSRDFPVLSAAFSPDSSTVLTGSQDTMAYLWDVKTQQQTRQFIGHQDMIESVAFSPGGAAVATASDDGTIKLWDVSTSEQIAEYRGHRRSVRAVAFSPDGTMLVSGSVDATVRLWNVPESAHPTTAVAPTVAATEQDDSTAPLNGLTCVVTTGRTVNRRAGPGTNFAQAGSLINGQTVNAVGQMLGADGKVWYKLDDDTWVRSDLVQLDTACAGLTDVGG